MQVPVDQPLAPDLLHTPIADHSTFLLKDLLALSFQCFQRILLFSSPQMLVLPELSFWPLLGQLALWPQNAPESIILIHPSSQDPAGSPEPVCAL